MAGTPGDVTTDVSTADTAFVLQQRDRAANIQRALLVTCASIAAAIIVTTFIALAKRVWLPMFDVGLIWLRSTDVGTRDAPLVGPYSRFGWDHPGPFLYYVMAAFLRVMNLRPTALLVGALAINMAATAGALILVVRHAGGWAGVVLAAAFLGLSYGLDERLITPWNPTILVLPFALFLICAWLGSNGQFRVLPLAAITASFCVQNHVGVTAAVGAIALAACVLRCTAATRFSRAELYSVLASSMLALILWAPPIYQQLTHSPGNLSQVVQFFFGHVSDQPQLGARAGIQLAASELRPWGAWLGFQRLTLMETIEPVPGWFLLAPLASLGIAAALAMRFRDALALRLALLVAAGVGACVYSYASIRGMPLGYLAVWPRVIAMLCVATPLMVLARRVVWHRVQTLAITTLVAVVLSAQGLRAIQARMPDEHTSKVHAKFAPAIARALPPGTRVRAAATGIPFTVSPEAIAIILLQAGRSAVLTPFDVRIPGAHRSVGFAERLPTIAITSGPMLEVMAARPDASLLEKYDPLSPKERGEARALGRLLARQLHAAGFDGLIPQLHDAAYLSQLRGVAQLNRALLERYIELVDGDERRAYAVFKLEATAW